MNIQSSIDRVELELAQGNYSNKAEVLKAVSKILQEEFDPKTIELKSFNNKDGWIPLIRESLPKIKNQLILIKVPNNENFILDFVRFIEIYQPNSNYILCSRNLLGDKTHLTATYEIGRIAPYFWKPVEFEFNESEEISRVS